MEIKTTQKYNLYNEMYKNNWRINEAEVISLGKKAHLVLLQEVENGNIMRSVDFNEYYYKLSITNSEKDVLQELIRYEDEDMPKAISALGSFL